MLCLKSFAFGRKTVFSILMPALYFSCFLPKPGSAQDVSCRIEKAAAFQSFVLENDKIKCTVTVDRKHLIGEKISGQPDWLAKYGTNDISLQTDGGFALDLMWTGWRAPGKKNNGDNFISLSQNDFMFSNFLRQDLEDGGKEINLYFNQKNSKIQLAVTYRLQQNDFFIRRKIAVRDTVFGEHFLHRIWPLQTKTDADITVLKNGGFGQPAAFLLGDGGVFAGLEYPASREELRQVNHQKMKLKCGQEVGQRIGREWFSSAWAVTGLSPNHYVKLWFNKYVDKIRVAPLRPFLLYNSWYDVRAPEYTKRQEDVMNETNLLRIIRDFKREMVDRYNLKLNAFVLDDGWDIYKSDWVLRKKEFPNGLQPVVTELQTLGAKLGIWFGPIGGYSHRDWRVNWMKEHGYEVTGNQLCLGGKNYHRLFKKRVMDFVRNDGVGYFKWDGIQFSCSEPDHGHPVGIYSRRAIMDSVIDLCDAVRSVDPDIFLNITSGTWLSPWWVQYANTIWMQGGDFGYSDVPSINRRDAAITYRDFVLYEDFQKNNFWFPIANLMTHGIVKGHLLKLGGEAEPLDKFTDNAVLYVARGVAMWELYVSPNLLTGGEWNAVSKSIEWAKDRFDVLQYTEMIGGDPGEKKPYGYVHFSGGKGIVVARNPFIEPRALTVDLSPAQGLDPDAASLVVERIYPDRWISSELTAVGATLQIPLSGYETAIYEIYQLEDAKLPLLAGPRLGNYKINGNKCDLTFYNNEGEFRLLNPETVAEITYRNKKVNLADLNLALTEPVEPARQTSISSSDAGKRSEIKVQFISDQSVQSGNFSLLVQPGEKFRKGKLPEVTIWLDEKKVSPRPEKQKGRWAWFSVPVEAGKHTAKIEMKLADKKAVWQGSVSAWLILLQQQPEDEITFTCIDPVQDRAMPPRPYAAEVTKRKISIGRVRVNIGHSGS